LADERTRFIDNLDGWTGHPEATLRVDLLLGVGAHHAEDVKASQ
jgi:hypothetical protein